MSQDAGRPLSGRTADPGVDRNGRINFWRATTQAMAGLVKDVLMQALFDVSGASGAIYRFRRVSDHDDRPAAAGNFLYVRGVSKKAVIVYAGECDSLTASLERWETARLLHGADGLFVRLNVAAAVREAEQADIVAAHNPAMNRA